LLPVSIAMATREPRMTAFLPSTIDWSTAKQPSATYMDP